MNIVSVECLCKAVLEQHGYVVKESPLQHACLEQQAVLEQHGYVVKKSPLQHKWTAGGGTCMENFPKSDPLMTAASLPSLLREGVISLILAMESVETAEAAA